MSIARCYDTLRSLLRPRRRCARPHVRSLELEPLESRVLPAGTWTMLAHTAPSSIGTMMLLSDGTVMAQGGGTTSSWYKLTPDSTGGYINGTWSTRAPMSTPRLYFGSAVLPSGKVFVVGGEYSGTSGAQNDTNTGEIYDPVANSWSSIQSFPQSNFGDDPVEVLANGTILAGYLSGPQTNLYNPATNTWSAAGTKLRNDATDEEAWVKLPDGSILSYDIFSSISSGTGHAQRYVPSSNTWVDAGTVPVLLSSSAVGYELGPAFLLPDGRVFQIGGNGNTALYTPSTNTWVAGPIIPNSDGADDAPGAVLPNGHVIFAADTPLFHAPTQLFDFDPIANTITQMTLPSALSSTLNNNPSYIDRMLVLPTGEVLLTAGGSQLWDYNPNATPNSAWQPTISSVTTSDYITYTVTGTQLNGISEGANYGDDAQMASNYPIVRLSNGQGTFYARTFNWTSQVATGSTAVTTQFTLPSGFPAGTYTLTVIANGIASAGVSFTTNLGIVGSTPASGAIVSTPPTSFVLNFSEPVGSLASVQLNALQVNGLTATSRSLNGAKTQATFTYTTSPVTAQGLQTMTVAAGTILGQDGSANAAFSSSFRYDSLTLAVAFTTPPTGAIFTIPASSFTYDVHFNEPIDPSLVNVSNLVLSQGNVTAAVVQPGNQTVRYTLSGLTTEGTLTVTIPAGTLKDQYDNPAFTAFSGNYLVDDGTVPLPTPLAGVAPYGSLIYNTSLSSLLLFAGDTDQFTVAADPGQTLTVVVTPVASPSSPGPTPTVQLSDPSSTVLGSASASGSGQSALLQTVATTTGGNYTVSIGGQGSTTGNYTVQVYLDAAVEAASVGIGTDNTRATAQNLNTSFVTLQTPLALASRGAVIGSVGQVASDTRFYAFSLGAGELATVGLKNLSGSGDTLTLQNASGNTLASGVAGATNLDAVISNFVAPAAGTYYAVVGGSTAATYSLVVTRDGTLDTETHNTLATAQNVTGTQGVLGAVASPRPIRVAVQLSSEGGRYSTTLVNQLNNDTLFSFHAVAVTDAQMNTVAQLDNYDVVMLADEIMTVSAATAAALKSWVQTGQGGLVASAWLNYNLDNYSSAARASLAAIVPINVSTAGNWSYSTGTTITNSANPVTQGVANFTASNGEAPKGGVLSGATILAVNSTGLPAVVVDQPGEGRSVWLNPDYEYGDTTLTSGAPDRLLEQALAWAAPPLPQVDWYQVTLSGGQNALQVQTQTPLSGPNQAINALSSNLQLYNASSTLIASGTLLADGHNQSLLATGLTAGGTYYVKVTPASNSSGEYFLGVSPGQTSAVTTSPSNQTVVAGQPATFTAAASGNPLPAVQWQVSTDNGVTFTPISGATATTFTIAATSTNQNGNLYEAVFSNAYGSVTTAAASLTVQPSQTPPVFTSGTPPSSVAAGQTYSFTFTVSGSPAPTLAASNLPSWLTFNPATGVLTGSSPTAATYTNLQIVASNTAGSATTTFNVAVIPAMANQLVLGVQPTNTTAGAAIAPSVTVLIEDQFGNLESTDSTDQVTVSIASGPGTFSGSSLTTVTASAGVAAFSNLHLNTAGAYTLSDMATGGLTGPASSSFTVTPAAVSQLGFGVQPGNTPAGSALTPALTVTIEDPFGNVVSTDSTDQVTLGIASGPGTFSGSSTTIVTASSGVATFTNLHLNTAGTYALSESATGGLTGPNSTSFTVTPTAANQLVIGVQPSNTTAGVAISPAVTVNIEDQFGNLVSTDSTDQVTVGIVSGPGIFSGASTTTVTASAGVATFGNLHLNTAGTYTLNETATSSLTGPASTSFTVTPAAANQLIFGQLPTNTTAGTALGPAVTVLIEDQFDNLVSTDNSDQVTVSIASGPGTFSGSSTTTVTASAGVATFSNLYLNAAGSYTLSENAAFGTGPASSGFTVTPAAINKLTFGVQPSNTTAGAALAPAVTVVVEDQFGNVVTNDSTDVVLVGIASGPGTFSGGSTTSVAVSAGIGTFSNLHLNTAGGYTLSESGSSGLTGLASNGFTVTPAAANQLVFGQQPTNTTAGTALGPAVTVLIEDPFGNLVSTDNSDQVNVAAAGPGTFTGISTTTVTASGGVATFSNLRLNIAGSYSFSETAGGGIGGVASIGFTITPAAVNQLVFGGLPSTTTAGAALSPAVTVQVEDAFGNVVTADSSDQVTVGLASGPGTFSASSTTTVTASGGVATFSNLDLNAAGTYTLSETTGSGFSGAASSSFTVTAGAVDHLAVTAFPSSLTAGTTLGLIVTALDQFGNPTTDAGTVTFTSNDPLAPSPVSSAISFVGGTAFAIGTLKTATATGWTIQASDSTTHGGSSNPVLVNPAAATHFGVSAAAVASAATIVAGTGGASESGATVTINTTTPHGFTVGQSVNISGVGVAGYNGTVLITSVTAMSFTYTALANQLGLTASGGGTVTSVATTGSPFNVVVTALDPYGNTAIGYAGTVQLTSSDAAATFPVNHYTFTTSGGTPDNGVHTFSATLNTSGTSQTITATDAGNASLVGTNGGVYTVGLFLTAFAATPSGFTATFNKLVKTTAADGTSQLDYYRFSGESVPPDISMTVGSSTTSVNGSVVVTSTPTQTTLTFVNTGGALALNQAYTVTLGSGSHGILDTAGGQFAGDANGVLPGTSYSVSVIPVTATLPTLVIAGFARGPGSNVLLPNSTGTGIPVTLKNASAVAGSVTSVTFTLDFNPALLNVIGPTSGNLLLLNPPTVNSTGVANFAYNGPALNGTSALLGQIVARVPSSVVNQYKAKALLDLPVGSIIIQGVSSSPAAPFQSADGVDINAYQGDVNADYQIDGSDAALVAGVLNATNNTASQPAGFGAYALADPALLGSPNSNPATATPKITSADVTLLNRYAAGLNPVQVPMLPTGLTFTAAGPDPALSLPTDLWVTAAGTVTVPVNLDDARPAGSTGLTEAVLALTFDPRVFTVSAADIHLGTIAMSGSGWTLTSVVNAATGQLGITLESLTPIASALAGSLVTIDFHLQPGAVAGATAVRLVATVDPNGGLIQTRVFDGQGQFTLNPAPTNGGDDPVTGLVRTVPALGNAPEAAPVAGDGIAGPARAEDLFEAVPAAPVPAITEDEETSAAEAPHFTDRWFEALGPGKADVVERPLLLGTLDAAANRVQSGLRPLAPAVTDNPDGLLGDGAASDLDGLPAPHATPLAQRKPGVHRKRAVPAVVTERAALDAYFAGLTDDAVDHMPDD